MVERYRARRRMETGQHLSVYKDEQRSTVGYARQYNYIVTITACIVCSQNFFTKCFYLTMY
jgi:hypothetical protein